MLFKLDQVGKEFGGVWLFQQFSAQCNPGDRIGLIGDNGVGKTTLFDLLENRIAVDSGRIMVSNQVQFYRVDQIPRVDSTQRVFEEALTVFQDLSDMENRLRILEAEMSSPSGPDQSTSEEYELLQNRFLLEGGFDCHSRTEKVLQGLGFSANEFEMPCEHLSGGQVSRLGLVKALLKKNNFLLLDEPTNHLDLKGILWLTDYLRESDFSYITISHDRRFLDRVSNRTWEIEGGRLWDYPCPFSRSRRLRQQRLQQRMAEYERQQEWKRKTEEFIRKNLVGQKTKQAQARRLQLEKTSWIEKPVMQSDPMVFRINEAPRGNSTTVSVEEADLGYSGKPLIHRANLVIYRGDRIGVLGGNGSGKTTLLKSLLGRLPPVQGKVEQGDKNLIGYYAQEARFGNPSDTVFQHLTRIRPDLSDQELRDYSARFRFPGEAIHRKIQELSGGERSRLSLAVMLLRPANFLVLDEPTNHLDITSRESLERALSQYQGSLVVVSHDLYFLRQTVNRFLLLKSGMLREYHSLDQLVGHLSEPDFEKSGAKERPADRTRMKTPKGLSKNEQQRIRKKLEGIEAQIDGLEIRKSQIEAEMDGGLKDHLYLNKLASEFHDIEEKLSQLYLSWEGLENQLRSAGAS